MGKRVLITGTSGRIGESIAETLATAGYSVTGVDKTPGRLTSNVCDIGDLSEIRKLMPGVNAIVHSAAYHAPHVGIVPVEEFTRVNVDATKSLAEISIEFGVERFIFTSTTALYGYASQAQGKAVWIDETVCPKPKTIYHTTKLQAEKILEGFTRSTNLKTTVIRMSRCFAEPADLMAVYRLHRGVDRRDVAVAHKLALENESLPAFDIFIISGKTPFVLTDCADLVHSPNKLLEACCPDLMARLKEIGSLPASSIDRVYDSSKAMRVLGWSPMYGYSEIFNQLSKGSSEVLPPTTQKSPAQEWQAE